MTGPGFLRSRRRENDAALALARLATVGGRPAPGVAAALDAVGGPALDGAAGAARDAARSTVGSPARDAAVEWLVPPEDAGADSPNRVSGGAPAGGGSPARAGVPAGTPDDPRGALSPTTPGTRSRAETTPEVAAAGPAGGGGVASLWTPGRSTDALCRVGGGNPPADTARFGLPVSAGPIGDLVDRVRARISRSAVLDPGRRGVAALAAVALIACGVAGWSAWRARPRTEPVAAVAVAAGPSTAGPAAASTGPAEVVVAVGGTVRRPGLVRLRPGSRVADAVRAAGGILPGSDLGALNLARKVTDGELVMVGSAAAAEPATGSPAGTLVNLNTATAADLDALPGVGPVLAQRIVDFRREHGSFASVDQLREVTGIGDAKLEQLRDRVTV